MIQLGTATYGRPPAPHRCTYCHAPLPGRQQVINPSCGAQACLERADDAAQDAAHKRRTDGLGDR